MHSSRIWQLVYLNSVIFIVRNTDSYCLKMNYVQQRANLNQNKPMTTLLDPEPVNLLALLPQAQSWQVVVAGNRANSAPIFRGHTTAACCVLIVLRQYLRQPQNAHVPRNSPGSAAIFKKWVVAHALTMPLCPHAAQFIAPYDPAKQWRSVFGLCLLCMKFHFVRFFS